MCAVSVSSGFTCTADMRILEAELTEDDLMWLWMALGYAMAGMTKDISPESGKAVHNLYLKLTKQYASEKTGE